MDSIARAWEAAAQEPRGFEFIAREELSRLVLLLTDEITRPRQAHTSRQIRSMERVERMMEFIREHYAREISVAEIAQSVALSQSECIRCFRETLGITPFRWCGRYAWAGLWSCWRKRRRRWRASPCNAASGT